MRLLWCALLLFAASCGAARSRTVVGPVSVRLPPGAKVEVGGDSAAFGGFLVLLNDRTTLEIAELPASETAVALWVDSIRAARRPHAEPAVFSYGVTPQEVYEAGFVRGRQLFVTYDSRVMREIYFVVGERRVVVTWPVRVGFANEAQRLEDVRRVIASFRAVPPTG